MALLKRDHGIEVRSASSTIEEVVGRQFVERLARQRNVQLPSGDMFAERPTAPGAKKVVPGKKPEPPKPQAPTLGPPRLIKTVRPAAPAAETAETPVHEAPFEEPADEHSMEAAVPVVAEPEVVVAHEPVVVPEPIADSEPQLAAAEPAATVEPVAEPQFGGRASRRAPHRMSRPLLIDQHQRRPRRDGSCRPRCGCASKRRRRQRTRRSRRAPARDPRHARRLPCDLPRLHRVRPLPRPAVRVRLRGRLPLGLQGLRPDAPRPNYAGQVPGGPRPLPSHPVRPSCRRQAVRGLAPRWERGQPLACRPDRDRRTRSVRVAHQDRGRRSSSAQVDRDTAAPAAKRLVRLSQPDRPRRRLSHARSPLAEGMTVKDLADKLDVRVKDVLAKLLMKRMMMTINSTLDSETASMVAREFGADVEMRTFEQELLQVESEDYKAEDRVMRAPVVTVMGHVDHGKTTLLDAIRETRVAEREAGGITQHIGAYHVKLADGRSVVFLDTPGHAAFTMMRARGAKVTDVVVLVVAADDGVMPQTREAIDHAKAANVPIIVAVNKIDKAGANPDNVKRELAELGLVPEAWGGTTVMVDVSAKKRQNLDLLLEMVLLVTDIGELKANPKRNAAGTVLEAKLDRGRGPVATILVQDGTLHVGDTFIAGTIVGKVRALIDDRGRSIKAAPPSTPVEVLGLGGLPSPGDAFQALADAAKARQIALFRQEQAKARSLGSKSGRVTLESLQQQLAEGSKDLVLIIKADVQGSAEVLADSLSQLSTDKVKIKIIRSGVGAINESDVLLASASEAIIIGFNVRPDRNAADLADRESVDIRNYSVIYTVTDEIKKAMEGLLDPTFKETRLGAAEVRETFKVPKFGTIAGCMVTEGRIIRSGDAQARLLRDNVVVHEGKIGSLRRFKDDVSEVKSGLECGIGFATFNDIKVGDVIECFAMERVAAATA